jgi:hypothetical protein
LTCSIVRPAATARDARRCVDQSRTPPHPTVSPGLGVVICSAAGDLGFDQLRLGDVCPARESHPKVPGPRRIVPAPTSRGPLIHRQRA